MISKIYTAASLFLLSTILTLIVFTGTGSSEAVDLSKESNGDNPLKIVIKPAEDNQNQDNTEMDAIKIDELFGSDQVFPFVAGLDSYE